MQATTTPLVRNIFEQFFSQQLAGKSTARKRRRCGVCEVCQLPDCGNCKHCKDMIKFGGSGRSKQACVHRQCPNMAVQAAEEEEEEEAGVEISPEPGKKGKKKARSEKKRVEWTSDGEQVGRKVFYSSVLVNNVEASGPSSS